MHVAELTKEEVKVVPVTQSAYMQRNKLKYLLEKVDILLGLEENERSKKWTVHSEAGLGRGEACVGSGEASVGSGEAWLEMCLLQLSILKMLLLFYTCWWPWQDIFVAPILCHATCPFAGFCSSSWTRNWTVVF